MADVLEVHFLSGHSADRAGLTTVPFMPWDRAPVVRQPPGPPAIFFYHITFYNYGSIRVWRPIGLFYQTAPVLKSTGHFYKRGAPNPVPQDRVPETKAPAKLLNFTLRYGYSLWYVVIFVYNINVLDLALWAEKILKLNVFLCNLKKCIHCGQLILWKISKNCATRCQILRLKCQRCNKYQDPQVQVQVQVPKLQVQVRVPGFYCKYR